MQKRKYDAFKKTVWDYYFQNGRAFPWRETTDPYHILVSEFMLQQTQTNRVLPKYLEFVNKYSDFSSLAGSKLSEVIRLWQGLGYNRRAKYLHDTAKIIDHDYQGIVPKDADTLQGLPGIGPYSSGAISTFCYNIPNIFIETNIRTVFIHKFFADKSDIPDSDIVPILSETLDLNNPREWYYALMDYGTMIKSRFGNKNVHSRTYSKQSSFEGSFRQKRGMVLRFLTKNTPATLEELGDSLNLPNEILNKVLSSLESDGLVLNDSGKVTIKDS